MTKVEKEKIRETIDDLRYFLDSHSSMDAEERVDLEARVDCLEWVLSIAR